MHLVYLPSLQFGGGGGAGGGGETGSIIDGIKMVNR